MGAACFTAWPIKGKLLAMALTTALRLCPYARNEDRAKVVKGESRVVVVVADGAGGMPGGAEAADVAVADLEQQAAGLIGSEMVVAHLQRLDLDCEQLPLCGEAACVVLVIDVDGRVFGASVGDCEAWIISGDVVARLTQGQHRKKRLGSGVTTPIAFEATLQIGDILVVGSDGLFGFVTEGQIVRAPTRSQIEVVAQDLVDAAIAAPVKLADDLAVVVVRRVESPWT